MKKSQREYYIETYGDNPYDDKALLMLYKQFKKNQLPFTYIALHIDNLWYVTGKTEVYTWPELLEFFETDNLLGPEGIFALEDCSSFEQVYEEELED